jgi:hypothetical protein
MRLTDPNRKAKKVATCSKWSYPFRRSMLSPRLSPTHAVHWLLAALLLLLGGLAVLQPEWYLFLFTSKGVLFFVWFAGIVLLYFLLREDRA